MPETESPTDIEFETLFTEPYHVVCCIEPRFYCGQPFHEELMAPPGSDPEECCDVCMKIFWEWLCPPQAPTHAHCPFTSFVCPPQ
jgi:hypothetical protein